MLLLAGAVVVLAVIAGLALLFAPSLTMDEPEDNPPFRGGRPPLVRDEFHESIRRMVK